MSRGSCCPADYAWSVHVCMRAAYSLETLRCVCEMLVLSQLMLEFFSPVAGWAPSTHNVHTSCIVVIRREGACCGTGCDLLRQSQCIKLGQRLNECAGLLQLMASSDVCECMRLHALTGCTLLPCLHLESSTGSEQEAEAAERESAAASCACICRACTCGKPG